MSVLGPIVSRLGDLLYPRRCVVCGNDLESGHVGPLCAEDRRRVVLIEDPFCDRCGAKVFGQVTGDCLCADCRQSKRRFDRAYSATVYNDVMEPLVHRYKYGMRQYLAEPLARWMIDFAYRYIDAAELDAVVPVPLHWWRFRYRGFNQAVALARPLGREFGLPVIKHVLRRTRHTVPQVGLSSKERLANIKGAFGVRNAARIKGKRLLLIDDVYTTGATVDECAGALKKAGAASVVAFTLTRPI